MQHNFILHFVQVMLIMYKIVAVIAVLGVSTNDIMGNDNDGVDNVRFLSFCFGFNLIISQLHGHANRKETHNFS